jgi:hypothetical protein
MINEVITSLGEYPKIRAAQARVDQLKVNLQIESKLG